MTAGRKQIWLQTDKPENQNKDSRKVLLVIGSQRSSNLQRDFQEFGTIRIV